MVNYMNNKIRNLLAQHNLTEYGIIDFDKLTVINPRILPKEDIKSVLFILIPYRTGNTFPKDGYNMGLFGRIKDYHIVFSDLSSTLVPQLEKITGGKAFPFADHSPIFEKDGAAKCGLGGIGKNSLLINPIYGSFVFIGSFMLTAKVGEVLQKHNISCGNCNICEQLCPNGAISQQGININLCLSGISQKKKKTEADKIVLKRTKTVWGCDICQSCCPYNQDVKPSPFVEFDKNALETISAEIIEELNEAQYNNYAFSYRDKKVITENLLTAKGECDILH